MPRRLLDHLKSEIAQGWVIVGTATQWPVRPTADLALLAKRVATGIFVLYNSHGDWSAGRPHHARGDVGRPRWVLADIEICCDADHKRFLRVRTRCYGERETVARSLGLMRSKVGGRSWSSGDPRASHFAGRSAFAAILLGTYLFDAGTVGGGITWIRPNIICRRPQRLQRANWAPSKDEPLLRSLGGCSPFCLSVFSLPMSIALTSALPMRQ